MMYICPNCKKTSEEEVKFCADCGTQMVEQVVEVVEAVEAQPQYQYADPQVVVPANPAAQPSLGKVITGMALSIGGLVFAAIGLLYVFIGLAVGEAMGFAFAVAFSIFCAPLSIIGFVLSNSCVKAGSKSKMSSIGKTIGLIALIITAAMVSLGFLGLV